MAEDNNVKNKECDLKHKPIDESVAALWKKINAMDNRLWVLVAGVLASLVSIWLK